MAIEIKITKELGNYKPSLIGPFTARQTVCLVIAVPLAMQVYSILSPLVTKDVAGFFVFPIAAAAWLFGWKEPYGMPAEKFLKSIFVNVLLAPQHRKYKISNTYEELIKLGKGLEKKEEDIEGKPKKKEKPDKYRVSLKAIK